VVPIAIRKALKSDLETILALYADLEIGDSPSFDLHDAERIFERMKRYPNYSVYVAELEGKIIGAFALLIMDNLAHRGAPSGVVEDVVVHAEWRGRGIGKAVMQFAMEQCCQAGCYKLALSSNLKRESAHKFYESLGFERHGYSFLVNLDE
jgi:GNAT superfamily N-acetyltransferase